MNCFKKIFIYFIIIFLLITTTTFYLYNFNSTSKTVISLLDNKLPIYGVDTNKKEIALTFDINWAEKDYLEDILKTLDKYSIKATFFIMGKWVTYTEKNTKNFIAIKNAGHEIGNHSYIHPMFSKISNKQIEEELNKTEKIFNNVAGVNSKIFRFPSGDFNESSLNKVESLGYKCIQWNLDSIDYKEVGADIEYNRIIKKVKPGDILLFHNNAKYTPNNIEKIILKLSNEGYQFKLVSELIYKNGYIDNNGIQHKIS